MTTEVTTSQTAGQPQIQENTHQYVREGTLGSTRVPAAYLMFPLLVAVALMLARATFSLGAPASDGANLAAAAPAPEAHVFEFRVTVPGCSIEEVDSPPATPGAASVGSVSVYADDLYETYVALCRGRADE